MTQISYPSEVVPGPPPITLEMPEGWEQVWAPDTLIAIRDRDEGATHFLANVVVRFYQRLAPFGPEEIHAELKQYAQQRQEGTVGQLKHQEVDGREFVGADVAFVDVPGHERFIPNMLAGLGPAPVVLFVVAADEDGRSRIYALRPDPDA